MTLSNYFPLSLEQDLLQRKAIADQQFEQGKNMDAGTVARILSIKRNWAWLSPGATLSMAQSGYSGYSPEVKGAAQLELSRKQRASQFSTLLKNVNSPDDLKSITKDQFNRLTADEKDQLKGRALDTLSSGGMFGSVDLGYSAGRLLKYDAAGAIAGGNHEVATPGDNPQDIRVGSVNVSAGLRGATRQAVIVASAPMEQGYGYVRNAARGIENISHGQFFTPEDPTTSPYLQSQLGQELDALHAGKPIDVGSGYLPDPNSKIAQQVRAVQAHAAPLVGGHVFTLGRYAANQVFEPGTTGFTIMSGLIDAGVAIKGDPSSAFLRGESEARSAGHFFTPEPGVANRLAEDSGTLITGEGRTVVKGTASAFLDSPKTGSTLQNLANAKSASDIWRMMGKKIDTVTAEQLAKAPDVEAVKNVLRPHLGTDIPGPFSVPTPGGLTYGFKNALDNHVVSGILPEHFIQPQDKDGTLQQLDRWMQTAHIPVTQRQPILDKFIAAPDQAASYNAITAMSDVIKQRMLSVKGGVNEAEADRLTKLFPESSELSRSYDFDQIAKTERMRPGVVIDGNGTPVPTPELTTEWLNSGIRMPDPTSVRRATSAMAPIVTHPLYTGTSAIADAFMQGIWKPFHLLRPALGLRVVGDSQASLAANGYMSLFSHPVDYISAMIGGNLDKKWAQKLGQLPGVKPSYIFDGLGEPMVSHYDDDVMRTIYGGWSGIEDPTKVMVNEFKQVAKADPKYAEGLASELMRLRGDPRVQGIVAQESPAAAKDWFWSGEGAQLRESFIPQARDLNAAHTAQVAAGDIAGHIPLDFESKAGSDAFVDALLARIGDTTAGHPDLMEALRSGKINDVPLWKNNGINKHAVNQIQGLADAGIGPETIKAQSALYLTRSDKLRNVGFKDKAVQYLFDHILTLPDASFDRIPALSQGYWGAPNKAGTVERYLPYITPEDYPKFLKNAEENNLPADVLQRIKAVSLDGGVDTKRLSLADMTKMGKSDALHNVQNLVHDLHTRSQFFDMTRLLFPFGDAFRRIALRWSKTVWDNPAALRRFQQGVTEAKSSGFFHKDPVTGEQVFTYPGSQWLTDKLIGVPVPLTGAAKGLSMVGEGYPGVGPAVTLPAQWFLPDTPQYDGVRDIIFPFGQPSNEGVGNDIAQQVMPPWLSKIVDGPPDQKTFNNTVGSMVDYLASTGRYNLHGANATGEMNRMLSDAKDKARWFYVIRGAAQAVSPSAPAPAYQLHDKTGHLQVLQVVKNDYQKQLQKVGPDGAMKWLIDHYGEDNVFVAQSFSQPIGYGIPVTKEGQDWAKENGDVKAKYPNTYGLFAPTQGKFDIAAFEDQFTAGERKSLTPEQQAGLANNRVGMWIYHQKRDQIIKSNGGDPLDQPQQKWMNGLKQALMKDYPGFNLQSYDSNRLPRAITELESAAKDPKLAQTDAGQGLNEYLQLRARATKEAQSTYGVKTPFKARGAAPLRDWLRGAAKAIIKDHPDFANVWDQVFSHEMVSDVTGAGETNG